jgi:surfactin synthase thioesterase subunit
MVTKNRWFPNHASMRRPDARLRVFCFPHAGGGASAYRQWGAALPPEVEVCPLELPGRYARLREPAYESMSRLIDDVVEVMLPRLDQPFVLFGYSMGGLIAFELARALRDRLRRSPERLIAAARPAPDTPYSAADIHRLPQAQLIEEISRRWGGLPPALLGEPEMLELSLQVLRADIALLTAYEFQAGQPLDCPIDVLGGSGDPSVTVEDLERWAQHTTGPVSLKLFPGGHFFRDEQPTEFLAEVAARIALCLAPRERRYARA